MRRLRRRDFVSLNLKLHGDSQEVVQWAFLAIAAAFWVASVFKSGPVMRAETYGDLVILLPTQFWAGSLLLASTSYLSGIMINGKWPVWSPLLRLAGALWHSVTLVAFSFGALTAPYGENLAISAGVFAAVHIWFAALNADDLRQAWRAHDGR